MKTYPYETPSSQLDYVVRHPYMAEIRAAGFADDFVDCGQPPLRYQAENPYRRQLFRSLITTALLAAITVIAWLSLTGIAPGAHAQGAAGTNPAEQPITSTTSS
jgi:hypothetical protein